MVRQAPGEEVSCLQPILVDRIFGFSLFNIIHIKVLKVWFCSLYSGQLRIYFLLLHFTNKKACLLPRRLFLSHIVSSLASHCWLQINKRFNNGESFSTHQLLLKILQRCKPYMYPHQQEQLLSLEVGPGTWVCVSPSTVVLSLRDHPHCCKLLEQMVFPASFRVNLLISSQCSWELLYGWHRQSLWLLPHQSGFPVS